MPFRAGHARPIPKPTRNHNEQLALGAVSLVSEQHTSLHQRNAPVSHSLQVQASINRVLRESGIAGENRIEVVAINLRPGFRAATRIRRNGRNTDERDREEGEIAGRHWNGEEGGSGKAAHGGRQRLCDQGEEALDGRLLEKKHKRHSMLTPAMSIDKAP